MSRSIFTRTIGVLAAILIVQSVWAQKAEDDLSTVTMENLTHMQVSVSSFARKDEDLWKTPAAVFVITREDIERSAATSVPELLRMVPGMQVAQTDASKWVVSARGFNSAYGNKLLVLIDGRTVYSEIYAGAHWDQDDLPLDEIERIEVIRGPGAAVWGTNAVNGVVNIITRRARGTSGLMAVAEIGRIDEMTNFRYGGAVGDRLQYRGYVNYVNREPFETAGGKHAFDGENAGRGGGRVDWQRSQSDWLTLTGDLYGGQFKQQTLGVINLPVGPGGRENDSIAGGYVLSRWERKLEHSQTALQMYFDDTSRHQLQADARTRTLDADFQDHLALGTRNDLVVGAEFRFTADHIGARVPLTLQPDYRNSLVDAFAQDDITLVPGHLVLTVGSKVQRGTLAGFQVQPSARLLWSPDKAQSLWAAFSRAAAAPSIQDRNIAIPLNFGIYQLPGLPALPLAATLQGNPDIKPETVRAYETGYRRRVGKNLAVDLAGFFNVNQGLQAISLQNPVLVPAPAPHLFTELLYTNGYRARSGGVEAALSWKPLTQISIQASYAWMQVHTAQSDTGYMGLVDTWSTPRNTFTTSAWWSFAPAWSLNAFVYRVDALPLSPFPLNLTNAAQVPGYTRLDVHIVRKVGRFLQLDAGGTNLLRPRHIEFWTGTDPSSPAYVPRSLFVRSKVSF